MQEWVEIRRKAEERLRELSNEIALLQKGAYQLRSGNIELSDDDKKLKASINDDIAKVNREIWIIRGQLSVINKLLNYDYPFEVGKAYSVQHKEIHHFY